MKMSVFLCVSPFAYKELYDWSKEDVHHIQREKSIALRIRSATGGGDAQGDPLHPVRRRVLPGRPPPPRMDAAPLK